MPSKKKTDNPLTQEKQAQADSEAATDLHSPIEDEEAEKAALVERGAQTEQVTPAEVAAISEVPQDQTSSKLERKKEKKIVRRARKETENPSGVKGSHKKASKYTAAKAKLEPGKLYPLKEAIGLVKQVSTSSFDGAVELHLRAGSKKSKTPQHSERGVINLPHGTGKQKKIIVLDEKKIDEIAKTKKIDFDIALARPELMSKVAKVAKILGPAGKMPDLKSGTVTDEPDKVIEQIKQGKTEYRLDSGGNLHQIIGRVSWEDEKLLENAQAVINSLGRNRIVAGYLSPSIGPAVPLEL